MTLLELLVKELPKLGGWPGDRTVASNGINGTVVFHSKGRAPFLMGGLNFSGIGCVSYEEYESALAALKQPEWGGEGLPPVGCVCEIAPPLHDAGTRVRVLCHDENAAVCRIVDGDSLHSLCQLEVQEVRPIRTEADLKREEAIATMRNFATNYNNTAVIHAIEQVYDSIAAGKIPHITLK